MRIFAIIYLIIIFSFVTLGSAQSPLGEDSFDKIIHPSLYPDMHTILPLLVVPFYKYPGNGTVFRITGTSGDVSFMYVNYDALSDISLITPFEQEILEKLRQNLSEEGFLKDTLTSYRIHQNRWYSEDEFNFSETTEVELVRLIQGMPRGTEIVGFYYRVDLFNNIVQKGFTNVTLDPFENVPLESPYEVVRSSSNEMMISQYENQKPVIISNISLGYYFNKRPYQRGEYYEPVWIFRGLDQRGEPVTVFSWASKERGRHPPKDDLDTAKVCQLIIHDGSKINLTLQPGDAGFDVLEAEVKDVLRSLFGECPCYISPEKKAEQKEEGFYIEVVFREQVNTVVPLDIDAGPQGMIEEQWDSVIIPFRGPFGRMVYVLYHNDECNCTVWGLHDSLRNTTTLENLARGISR